MTRRKLVVAAAAAIALLAAGAGAMYAQSEEDAQGRTLFDRVADKLGIETDTLEQAFEDARNDQINEAVERGDITEEEAERLRERLEALPDDAPFLFHGHGYARGFAFGFAFGSEKGFKFGLIGPGLGFDEGRAELAAFLGITAEQLREELTADGATLASVAEAHGKTRDELKAFIEGKIKEQLDAAVAEGNITQERADEMLANVSEKVDHIIDRPLMKPFRGGPRHLFPRFRDGEGGDESGDPNEEQGFEVEEFFSS